VCSLVLSLDPPIRLRRRLVDGARSSESSSDRVWR